MTNILRIDSCIALFSCRDLVWMTKGLTIFKDLHRCCCCFTTQWTHTFCKPKMSFCVTQWLSKQHAGFWETCLHTCVFKRVLGNVTLTICVVLKCMFPSKLSCCGFFVEYFVQMSQFYMGLYNLYCSFDCILEIVKTELEILVFAKSNIGVE